MKSNSEIRPTLQMLRALKVLMDSRGYKASGADVMKIAGLPSGTVYPLLARMEAAGWLRSEWEEISPSDEGRPRRRYYFLTGVGQKAGQSALSAVGLQWRAVPG